MDQISLLKYCESIIELGIKAITIFPSIDNDKKTPGCEEAIKDDNLM